LGIFGSRMIGCVQAAISAMILSFYQKKIAMFHLQTEMKLVLTQAYGIGIHLII